MSGGCDLSIGSIFFGRPSIPTMNFNQEQSDKIQNQLHERTGAPAA